MRAILFAGALAASLAVALLVLRGQVSPWLALTWFLSLFPFAMAARPAAPDRGLSAIRGRIIGFRGRAARPRTGRQFRFNRMHTDEFLTGYFSATHDFAHTSFFGFIPEYWEWQGHFPTPFFFLQRVFFSPLRSEHADAAPVRADLRRHRFGHALPHRPGDPRSEGGVRRRRSSPSSPSASIWRPSGFMFISSTAIFTVFFYFALREYRTGEMFHAALAGMACGFCYLTYYSSYLALPMLLAFFALQWLRRGGFVLQNLVSRWPGCSSSWRPSWPSPCGQGTTSGTAPSRSPS